MYILAISIFIAVKLYKYKLVNRTTAYAIAYALMGML